MALGAEEEGMDASGETGSALRQFGAYGLGRVIGAGGMGVVYEARRGEDGRRVAVKLIRDAHGASPALLRRFALEAEAAARLEHPHIVRILEVGECEGHPYISMELIEGTNLETELAEGLRRAPGEIALLMATLARAVQHAHERGVLHRDLKPANILVDAGGAPHLTDFGLAKLLEPTPDAGGVAALAVTTAGAPGTPCYMSPEQVSGGRVGPGSDVYGLGAVLYALLAGRPPFQAATPLELFRQIAVQPAPRPRSQHGLAPPDLETICLKCLAKDPAHRYGTAGALADDLDRFVAGRPIRARPPTRWRRCGQWTRRNPLGAAVIASLVLGLGVALALLKVVNDQRREMELDRDQVFDEGMQKISQIWRDPGARSVMVSARELAILAGRSPAGTREPRFQFTLEVGADDGPSSTAQRYAVLLGAWQDRLEAELGGRTVFHLQLRMHRERPEESAARREVDLVVLNAVEFVRAEQAGAALVAIARSTPSREDVFFARADSGVRTTADLRGRALILPEAERAMTIQAMARLVDAGLTRRDLRSCVFIPDPRAPGPGGADAASGSADGSDVDVIDRVLRGEGEVGVTHRSQFERQRHRGLIMLEAFPETPRVLAARADLDPAIMAALRRVLAKAPAPSPHGFAAPGMSFVAESGESAAGSDQGSFLAPIRAARQRAAGF